MVYQIAFWRFFTKDKTLSGRPSDADEDDIKALIELDYHVTLREIEEKLKMPKSTNHMHIKRLGLVKSLIFGYHMN